MTNPIGELSPKEQELILQHRKRLVLVEGYKLGLNEAMNRLDIFKNKTTGVTGDINSYLMEFRSELRNALSYESEYPESLKP